MSKQIFCNVNYLYGPQFELKRGDVLVEDGIIRACGALKDEDKIGADVKACDDTHLLIPGFVNAHTHVAMTLLRDYGGGVSLDRWLNDYIWPAEARLTDDDVYWGTLLGLLEMAATGTTCFMEMYDHCDAICQAVADSGMRMAICRGSVGINDPDHKGIAENDAVFDRWHKAENDRIRVWYGPHAPNTCTGEYIQEMVDHARARHTGVHIHVAETKAEFSMFQEKYLMTPVAWLESLGVLDVPTLAAHCVWMTEADMDIFRKYKVSVAHNPISNLKLASGIADVTDMQKHGIVVGLGTDGASSNNSLNMHREMQVAALLHKVRNYDAQALGGLAPVQLASLDGACAMHWEDSIGCIQEGMQADLTLFHLDQVWNTPHHDLVSNLIYASQTANIESVYVQGRCVYDHGDYPTMDKEMIIAKAEEIAHRLVNA